MNNESSLWMDSLASLYPGIYLNDNISALFSYALNGGHTDAVI